MIVAGALQSIRDFPIAKLDDIIGPASVLILAPHQDDESLACGGLIADCCARGRPPVVMFVTDGAGSHPSSASYPPHRLRAIRKMEAIGALAALGLDAARVSFLGLPDTAAPHSGTAFDQAVTAIAMVARQHGCSSIAAPWRHDPHCDHLAAHHMAAATSLCCGIEHIAYPVWSWTLPGDGKLEETVTGARFDITPYRPAKRRAIAAHASQHGRLIIDDPKGFILPDDFLAIFDGPYEHFLFRP
jgi:LmbE family N-acetylglucosaminyl deacetylase